MFKGTIRLVSQGPLAAGITFMFLSLWETEQIDFILNTSFNFMAAVTVCSDFGAQENSGSLFPFFPSICHEVMGLPRWL